MLISVARTLAGTSHRRAMALLLAAAAILLALAVNAAVPRTQGHVRLVHSIVNAGRALPDADSNSITDETGVAPIVINAPAPAAPTPEKAAASQTPSCQQEDASEKAAAMAENQSERSAELSEDKSEPAETEGQPETAQDTQEDQSERAAEMSEDQPERNGDKSEDQSEQATCPRAAEDDAARDAQVHQDFTKESKAPGSADHGWDHSRHHG